MIHALSFDVEDYYHVHAYSRAVDRQRWDEYPSRVVESTKRCLDILQHVRATFFVLGHAARRHPSLVKDIAAAGHEIASHGFWHRRVDEQTPEQFREDVRTSKRFIEDLAGGPVAAYRAPSFSITPAVAWAYDVLVEEGYSVDSSMAAGRGRRSTDPGHDSQPFVINTKSGPLREFPVPAVKMFGRRVPVGGGGYLRLMPYWLTRKSLRSIESGGGAFCVYLHPWEFDLDQPRLTVPLRQAVRHRVGLTTTATKLRRLLHDFQFGTVGDCVPLQSAA
jgi:polysaccharide deacetylase family protein (PEP-CTERM system associated)